ncbi:hypothetical protein [Ruegeria sp. ANG-R]|uniref:hypothetical protein n=1 Tax=Ruegeria sp. ANG-R TaxID=1577903 RepID=UPI00068D300E|nr:hypothetical protein [Ruegeria sp. ANG-R]
MKIYEYDQQGVFLGERAARRDPRNPERWVIPGNTTTDPLPEPEEGKWPKRENDAWTMVEDHRGETYWRADRSEHVVTDLGPLPDGALEAMPALTLEERKAAAISEAFGIAIDIRKQVARNVHIVRAISWVNKVPYALMWKAHEDGGDENGPLAAIAAEAQAGFQIEADVKGTTAIALRDRTIEKNAKFFRATQLVEGMEGLAETIIPAAENDEQYSAAVAQLQSLQVQAMEQLKAITGESN